MHYITDIIFNLFKFWQNNGCSIILPLNYPVGAATFHPECFFGSLKNHDQSIVYLQPSIRKADGRYGKSPNRLLIHNQIQVIIKPAPLNIKDLYIKSLKHLGFNMQKNEVRFIDNNWESLSIGALGFGWECLLDLMEITQFTYFQTIGDIQLKSIPVELAYGLERLVIKLLGVDSIFDAMWDKNISYKDLFYQNEYQFSKYYLEFNKWTKEDFQKIYQHAINLSEDMYLAQYQNLLEMNDIFNSLDARKIIGQFERKNFIDIKRKLANICAQNFLKLQPN